MKIHGKPNVTLNDGEYIAIKRAYVHTERENWGNGCIGGTSGGWSCDCDSKFYSVEDALQWLLDWNCFRYDEWDFDGETFRTAETLNVDNRVADEDEIKRWKQGKIDLYYAELSAKLVIVKERNIDE